MILYDVYFSSPGVSQEAAVITHAIEATQSAYLSNSVYTFNKYKQGIQQKFSNNKNKWIEDTMFLSDSHEIISNEFYRKNVELGLDVIPLMLKDMKDNFTHWFYALHEITGSNPVNPENIGYVKKMIQDWLVWADENGVNYED